MAVAFLIIGVALILTAYRNTQAELFQLLQSDAGGYVKWAAAILAIGAIGYIPDMQKVSRALLALVLLVIVISNQGAFQNFKTAVTSSIPQATVPQTAPLAGQPEITVNQTGATSGSSGSAASTAASAAGDFLKAIPLIGALF